MEKTTFAIILAGIMATPVCAQDKAGFSLTTGVTSIGGSFSDSLDAHSINNNFFTVGAEYTFDSGLLFGLTTTENKTSENDNKFGSSSIFTGYEFDNGFRIKGGLQSINDSGLVNNGALLGGGYLFDNGIIIDLMISPYITGYKTSSSIQTQIGYKF